jgi:5-methyltetrahydrofolate--homocysteine methyltransferase
MDHGIAKADVIIDPLILPIGAVQTSGQQVFKLLHRIREELGVNTTGGASNISFGLPNRPAINAYFLAMMISHGLTSAITNPVSESTRQAVLLADMLAGRDEYCMNWIRANRKPQTEGSSSARRRRTG